jgi:UDP-glucose 4-epimerase
MAGLKAVADSVINPKAYYDTNLTGSIALVNAVLDAGVRFFVFSSSATVYGVPRSVPVTEETPLGTPSNPYGMTKLFIEELLRDVNQANPVLSVAILRYFNPVGAHPSGLIGERPIGVPNNLIPFICDVALGQRKGLRVFGTDYPTIDGTGVRDYIHVMDLAEGHRRALDFLKGNHGFRVWNLGTGIGYSVLQIISTFEKVCDVEVPYTLVDRRQGDVAEVWAGIEKTKVDLNWTANRGLPEMLLDSWRWTLSNAAKNG